jgi:hypothetical protein
MKTDKVVKKLKKIAKFKITEIENYSNLSTDLAKKQPKFYRSL